MNEIFQENKNKSNNEKFNKNDLLFELSWEVCNKVGGIYTVITSKISTILKHIKFENYFLIGPYLNNQNNNTEFSKQQQEPDYIIKANKELESLGIKIHYGNWKTPNSKFEPQTLLIEYLDHSKNINEIKGKLWEHFKIDSMNSQWYDFDEAILWSWSCGIAIEKISKIIKQQNNQEEENQEKEQKNTNQTTLIHAHEWMSGGAVFYSKINQIEQKENNKKKNNNNTTNTKIKTIFTTHATMLGRAMSGNNYNIYQIQKDNNINNNKFDADKKAYEIGVHTKHQSEKALANYADCFTTVSNITGEEATLFYSKKPDVLLYNGFNPINQNNNNSKNKEKILEIIKEHFFKYYSFDLSNTQIFYTSGRNEFKNKGVDIYIKSLNKLNKKLKEENSNKTIVNLFLIPIGDFEKINIENQDKSLKFAPLSTHKIGIENEIISTFLKENLINKQEDNVKVILIPTYLNKQDDTFSMNYFDIISNLDLGIFASYYEPWGYTPLESIAYATPAITTDFAGFGRAILENYNENHKGIKILKREETPEEKTVDQFYELLLEQTQKTKEQVEQTRNNAQEFAKNFTWNTFIKNYLNAYNNAKNNK